MKKQYEFGYGWYGLFVGDKLIKEAEPKRMMSTSARELNHHAARIGVSSVRWMLLSDEDKRALKGA